MITKELLDQILSLRDLAGWITFIDCGLGEDLKCLSLCDPATPIILDHFAKTLSLSERRAVQAELCGCALPSPGPAPANPPPTTPPQQTVPPANKCTDTLPPANTYSSGSQGKD